VVHFEKDARTEWQDLCTTNCDLLPSDVRVQNRYSGEYMLDTTRRTYSHRSVHWPRHSSRSAWRSGTPRAFPSTAMKSRKLYPGYILTINIESSPKHTNERDRPTVNKNGHREKVKVGVCNLGSSREMNGYKGDPHVNDCSTRTNLYAYVYPCIKASHRRISSCPCCGKS
jgi:hypothetical protein